MKYQLGISAFYHDSAACLLRDGEIIAAAQEERFTRKKHDASFPAFSIKYCLDSAFVDLTEVDEVIFYDKPFLKFERILETFYSIAPKGLHAFVKHIPEWIKEKLFFKKLLKDNLKKLDRGGIQHLEISFSEHHLSHAAWAYFTSPFDKSAVLTIDGVGEWVTTSIFIGEANRLKVVKEQHFPHSLGLLYSSFTQFLGFKINDGEYKMMGLAPYGDMNSENYIKFRKLIKQELVQIFDDGSIKLRLGYFKFLEGRRMILTKKWEELFGLKSRPADSKLQQVHCDFALAAQSVTEEIVLKLASEVKRLTGCDNLCLSGGVAYNCVSNGKLVEENVFSQIFIPPAVGDSGGAAGAALAAFYLSSSEKRLKKLFEKNRISFLGPSYSNSFVENFLKSEGVIFKKFDNHSELCNKVAELLEGGAVIGWMQGGMEFGARALGARSIIASPKVESIQSIVNQKIKFRESFRPFAPVLLEEDLEKYFELSVPSPYMALVSKIKNEFRKGLPGDFMSRPIFEKSNFEKSSFPGITHVDFSSRIQTVDEETNPNFFNLLKAFKERTGSSMLINTSFNIKDEPIVCTPIDAFGCFVKTGMDYLVLNNFLVKKEHVKGSH